MAIVENVRKRKPLKEARGLVLTAFNQPWLSRVGFLLMEPKQFDDQTRYVASVVELVEHRELEEADPTFELSMEAAQNLFDELWRSGFRPTKGKADLDGTIAAKDRHLEDMRAIAFGQLDVERPR